MRNSRTISELFDRTYPYCLDNILQRPYEWEKGRVVTFINSIIKNNLTREDGGKIPCNIGHFLTLTDTTNKVKYIFDGQQRLATLLILFANIKNHQPTEDVINEIDDILYVDESKTKPRLILRDGDNEVFETILNKGTDYLREKKKKSLLEDEDVRKKVLKNKLVVNYDEISKVFTNGKTQDELKAFYYSIIKNASFFENECESRDEGIMQFNALNAGQQALTDSRKAVAMLCEQFYKRQDVTKQEQNFIAELSGMSNDESKRFLSLLLHYNYKSLDYSENRLPTRISNLCNKFSNSEHDVIYQCTLFYESYYKPMLKKITEKSIGIFTNPFMQTAAMQACYVDLFTDKYESINALDENDKINALKALEWGYISNRCLRTGAGQANNLIHSIDNYKSGPTSLTNYIIGRLKSKGIYMSIENLDSLKKGNNNFYISLLLRCEYQYRNDLSIKDPSFSINKVTLEHIHPKKPDHKKVYECSGDLVETIGNYTLMGDIANKSNNNGTFGDKKGNYEFSPYFITKNLVKKYETWTDETIKQNADFYISLLKKYYNLFGV